MPSENASSNVPVGEWIEVPKGFSAVVGCYVDAFGVMRMQANDAPAIWHHPSSCANHQPPCDYRITNENLSEAIKDQNGALWCPKCMAWGIEDSQRKIQKALNNEQPLEDTAGREWRD